MSNDDLKTLRISECLNFCNVFMDDIKAASHDEIINTIFELALVNVHYGCIPETDLETRQVLAVYQADQALRKSQNDLIKMVADAENKSISPEEDIPGPVQ